MFERDHVAIENLQGMLLCCLTQGRIDEASGLFSEQARYLADDDGVEAVGRDAIARHFAAVFTGGKQSFFVLSHTPAIRVATDGLTARATWYASTLQLSRDGASWQLIQGAARFDAQLVREDCWRYNELQFYYLMTLEPTAYKTDGGPLLGEPLPEQALACAPSPRDYLNLSHMLGRWCQNRRDGAEEMFSAVEDISLELPNLLSAPARGRSAVVAALQELKRRETNMLPYPLSVAMLTSPLLRVDAAGEHAMGHWLMLSHESELRDNACVLHPCMGQLLVKFVREADGWKIRALRFCPLLRLPDNRLLEKESTENSIFGMESHWLNAPAPTGNRSEQAICDMLQLEEYITFWVSGLRYRSEAPFYYQRLALEKPEMLDYQVGLKPRAIGLEKVRQQIFAMTNKFATYQPKSPGNHIGTTPVMEIAPDGLTAQATWLDYGWTTAAEVFGITKPPYFANPSIGRYEMRFIKLDGVWKLYYFRWSPYYRMEKWTFDYATTRGWSGTTSCKRFPLPLDHYTYENDPTKKGLKIVLEKPMIDCPYEKPWTDELDASIR